LLEAQTTTLWALAARTTRVCTIAGLAARGIAVRATILRLFEHRELGKELFEVKITANVQGIETQEQPSERNREG